VGAFLVAMSRRRLNFKKIVHSLRDTARISGFCLCVFFGANAYVTFVELTGLPTLITNFVVSLPLTPLQILWVVIIFYMPLGCVIDSMPMILLTLPIRFPIVVQTLGYDPVWFGVTLVVLAEFSAITPPVGVNLFIVQGVTEASMGDVIRGVVPFIAGFIIGIVLLVYFPQIALWLPGTMSPV